MAVLVLNPPTDDVLHRVPERKAIKMIQRQVVEIVEVADGRMFGPYRVPTVVRLLEPVDVTQKKQNLLRTFSKTGVLERDHYTCAYCGRTGWTVDHVIPKSRGGATDWLNLVAACLDCNGRKRDRTPKEARMDLLWFPYVPNLLDAGRWS